MEEKANMLKGSHLSILNWLAIKIFEHLLFAFCFELS